MGVFGTRLFGQADRVPGLFSVCTRFHHINYMPLVPLASWLVIEGNDSGIELEKLRWNSVFLAWLRAPLWFACVLSGIFAATQLSIDREWHQAIGLFGVAVAAAAALYVSYHFAQASFDRAVELARLAQLPPEMIARIEQHFGRGVVLEPAA